MKLPEIEQEEQDGQEFDKKKIYIIVAIVIALLVIALGSCAIWGHSRKPTQGNIKLTDESVPLDGDIVPQGEDWDGEQNKKETNISLIEIPVYESLYVSEENPYIWLNNPETNEGIAYFQYSVKEGDDILFGEEQEEQVWVEAGKAVRAEMASRISYGEHEITICIKACDPKTHEPLNGAEVKTKITLQGGPINVSTE